MITKFCDWCGKEITNSIQIDTEAVGGGGRNHREYCDIEIDCAVNALLYLKKRRAYSDALSDYTDRGGLGRLHKSFDEYLQEHGIERVDERKVERRFIEGKLISQS